MKEFYMTAVDLTTLFKENKNQLAGSDLKAYFALMDNLTFGGKILKPQSMMAKEWGLSKSQFSITMRKFKNWKLVTINKNQFGQRYIQINDRFICKGRPSTKVAVVNG